MSDHDRLIQRDWLNRGSMKLSRSEGAKKSKAQTNELTCLMIERLLRPLRMIGNFNRRPMFFAFGDVVVALAMLLARARRLF